jgi:hypothetical protein
MSSDLKLVAVAFGVKYGLKGDNIKPAVKVMASERLNKDFFFICTLLSI